MKKTHLILFLSGILILLSCKNNTRAKAKPSAETKRDTVNADRYTLLFFSPNTSEFNALLKAAGENSGLHEVAADYAFYVNKVYDSLSKTDLNIKVVTERIIQYSTKNGVKYLDRLSKGHEYGIMFNAAHCDPKIEFGVMTATGIFQELTEYTKHCKSP